MIFDQRRGQVEAKTELDEVHRRLNQEVYRLREEKVIESHDLQFSSPRLACMRAGLTISLPTTIRQQDHGLILFVKDKSGGAGASSITIQASAGFTIDGATSVTISTNYGFKAIQVDYELQAYFLVG